MALKGEKAAACILYKTSPSSGFSVWQFGHFIRNTPPAVRCPRSRSIERQRQGLVGRVEHR